MFVQMRFGARRALGPRVFLQKLLRKEEAAVELLAALMIVHHLGLHIIEADALNPRGGAIEIARLLAIELDERRAIFQRLLLGCDLAEQVCAAQVDAAIAATPNYKLQRDRIAREQMDYLVSSYDSTVFAPSTATVNLVADVTDTPAFTRHLQQSVDSGAVSSNIEDRRSNPKPVVDFDDDFWELTLTLNLTVPYRLSKAVLPAMLQRKRGRIINVASINSKIGSFHGAAYAASKHGLLGLTRTLALEVAADGVTVNAICPGPVKTVMNDRRLVYDAKRKGTTVAELEKTLTPIGGRLEPEEVAPMAVFLASDEARMITGQAYNVDGGLVMF